MTNFKPIRTPNAIDQAVLAIKLSRNIGQENLDEIQALKQVFTDQFEKFDDVKMMGVQFSSEGMKNPVNKISGIELSSKVQQQEHVLVNERSDWVLHIVDDTIQIRCLNYTGWDKVSEYTNYLFGTIIGHLTLDSTAITEIIFQVNDVFIVNDDIAEIDFNHLFNHCKFLTENIWDKGLLWHVNSGWFENFEHPSNVLNVLNISTKSENTDPARHITLIEHMQKYQPNELVQVNTNEELPSNIFSILHQRNKDLIVELLTKNIKKGIGL